MKDVIEQKKKSPEEMQQQAIALTLENNVLRGCLEAVEREVKEIYDFAIKHDFYGDMFIVGTANKVLGQIKYVLTGKEEL